MILSIITVNYNNAYGLEKTIRSVVCQTFKDYEFIIIDGASTDDSKSIIEQYSDKITYWVSEPDKGIYNAMNKGIKIAKGDYLIFMNSGDYFVNENVLYKIFNDKEYNNISFIRGNQITDYKTHQQRWINFGNREITLYDLYRSSLHHQATFFDRNLFEKYGLYNEDYKIVSDWEFSIRLVLNDEKSIYTDTDIVVYDYGGISSNSEGLVLRKVERAAVLKTVIPECIRVDYEKIDELKHKEAEFIGYHPLINMYNQHRVFRLIFRIFNKIFSLF